MKARNSSHARFSFLTTALALGSALALAACAGGGDNGTGGAGGGTTPPATGGTTGGGSGNVVTFALGKADGAMTGYGWIALGRWDTATSPTCVPAAGQDERPISEPSPCPACGGSTKWSANDKLCVSGSIPKVVPADGGTSPDYDSNWGIQIGFNAGPIDGCLVPAPEPPTLKQTFTKVAFTVNTNDAVKPATAAIRGMIHRKGDTDKVNYCATILSGVAGSPPAPMQLTSFNTKCWDGSGDYLTKEDIPNIDKMGVQISSDVNTAYEIKDFCLSKVEFTD